MMGESELIDIDAVAMVETDLAYRLFDGKVTEWIPKSQCQDNEDGTFTIERRVAEEKGFV